MNRVTPESFLALRGDVPLLDVRSPAEFARGHIPGSLSFPLFSDEERAVVGTTYTQTGETEAVLAGLSFVGPRLADMAKSALETVTRHPAADRRVALTCWRGGMRSASVGWLLERVGLRPTYLQGGYKAYRKHVHNICAAPWRLLVLGGMTGGGKTDVLHELARIGSQVIDLEGLAKHRGSVFGKLSGVPQPQTEHFENLLADALAACDITRPIWVEDESQNIGGVNIPAPFFTTMRAAPLIVQEVPRADRLQRIVEGYDPAHNVFAEEGINRIRRRLGSENHRLALEALAAEDYTRVTELLLDYYDRAYTKQLGKHRNPAVHTLTAAPGEHPESLARRLRQWETA